MSPTGWIFNRTLRYRECVIRAGEEVVAFGCGRWEPDPHPDGRAARGYRDAPMRLVLDACNPKLPVMVSNDPFVIGSTSSTNDLARRK